MITRNEAVGATGNVAGVCVTLARGDKLWFKKLEEGNTDKKMPIVCWVIPEGGVVIPEFGEIFIVVVLPIIVPGKVVLDETFDGIVVLIIGDRVVAETFPVVIFIEELPIKFVFVLEIVALLTDCPAIVVFQVGKIVVEMLITVDEFNEEVLFNNADEFNGLNWVLLIRLTNVEFKLLDAIVFWNEFELLLIFDVDVIVVFCNGPEVTELDMLEELIVLFGINDE